MPYNAWTDTNNKHLYQLVTLLVSSTVFPADMDLGSELDIVSVYMSENLGNLEETTSPVLVNDPCTHPKRRSTKSLDVH